LARMAEPALAAEGSCAPDCFARAKRADAHMHVQASAPAMQGSLRRFPRSDVAFIVCSVIYRTIYCLPPPSTAPREPPPRDPMLAEPRLLAARALDPSNPLDPPPKASTLPPPRERSRLPLLAAPPEADRVPAPAPPAARLLRLPPCWPICWRAPACRFANESPRAAPPNLSAVARSRYGAPPRCCGLCCQVPLRLAVVVWFQIVATNRPIGATSEAKGSKYRKIKS